MHTRLYPYLPPNFPQLVDCAIRLPGCRRQEAVSILLDRLPEENFSPGCLDDPYLIEIALNDYMTLTCTFDPQGQCDRSYLLMQGPPPQLGSCVHYFRANGIYEPPGSRWRLHRGVVTLDKTGDETSCCFSPD